MVATVDDDLFKDTTMTFGEHLEELRSSLMRAVMALAIGFGIGLLLGNHVVALIQAPLKTALEKYYADRAIEKLQKVIDERQAAGEAIPAHLADAKNIAHLVYDEGLLFDEVYLLPADVLAELKAHDPTTFGDMKLPAPKPGVALSKKDLVRVFLWKKMSDDDRTTLKVFNVQEGFMIYIKASFVTGAVLASPFAFYFLWTFVAAGLYPHEKKYIHIFLPFSIGLFLLGAMLAYLLVFPPVLRFFFSFTQWMGIDLEPRFSEWLSFVLLLPLGFGLSFQLPLVMLFLTRIGVFDVRAYIDKWRIAVLIIAVLSMVLSPGGDPYSMMMMFVPLVLLYFGGIALCKRLSPGGHVTSRADMKSED